MTTTVYCIVYFAILRSKREHAIVNSDMKFFLLPSSFRKRSNNGSGVILPATTKHEILGILQLGLHDQSNLCNLLHNRMVIQPLEIPLNLSKTLCAVTPSSSSKFRRGISCIDVLRDLLDVFVPGVRVCNEFVGVAVMIGGIRVDPMTGIVVESVAFTFHCL
ncbi:hypothetical protein Tco_0472786 [Tanacetum coccineum]